MPSSPLLPPSSLPLGSPLAKLGSQGSPADGPHRSASQRVGRKGWKVDVGGGQMEDSAQRFSEFSKV